MQTSQRLDQQEAAERRRRELLEAANRVVLRDGPEAALADRLITDFRTLARLPELVRRIEARYPAPGGAPPAPPLKEIEVVRIGGGWRYLAVAVLAAAVSVAVTLWVTGL